MGAPVSLVQTVAQGELRPALCASAGPRPRSAHREAPRPLLPPVDSQPIAGKCLQQPAMVGRQVAQAGGAMNSSGPTRGRITCNRIVQLPHEPVYRCFTILYTHFHRPPNNDPLGTAHLTPCRDPKGCGIPLRHPSQAKLRV